jgi:hypothetical protein
MNLDELEIQLIENAKQSINNIKLILSNDNKLEHKEKFISLANLILDDDSNPYGYMPKGWEDSKQCAQYLESFLSVLEHAIIDDGEYSFIIFEENPTRHPMILFISEPDIEPRIPYRISYSVEEYKDALTKYNK